MKNDLELRIDDELQEYEKVIKEIGVQAIWLIGEQLKLAKQKVIEITKDKRAPGFIKWANEKFGWSKMTVSRYIKAFEEQEMNIKKIWGNEKSVTLTLPNYPTIPAGKWATIVADPPWPVESIVLDKWESPIEDKYKTMSLKEIKLYLKHDWKADSCNLFLWTIHSFLRDAFDVMDSWGFKYFCCITWDKKGGWSANGFHKRTELCLYGYYNKISINQTGEFIPTIIEELKREHSRKPIIFDDILRKNTPEPRLELFPREAKDGFKCPGYN